MSELIKTEIEKLYIENKISIRKIAKMYSCSDRTIHTFMINNNIPIQYRNNSELSKEIKTKIEKLYGDGLNPRQIGEKLNLSSSKVKSYLLNNGIWINVNKIEKDELKYMYNVEKLSLKAIAERKNCSIKRVQLALKRYKIKKTHYKFNKMELSLLYCKYHIPLSKIAEMKSTTPYFVKKALKQYNIA